MPCVSPRFLTNAQNSGNTAQGLGDAVNFILSQAPELRPFVVDHYTDIMTAWWPPGTCGGLSFRVMDTELRNAPGPTAATGGYSIEVWFPTFNSDGNLAFFDIVDTLIAQVSQAISTFLVGWLAIWFTGATRASIGMQQFAQTSAIEISTLPNIDGELTLLGLLLELMLAQKGLPHWGQLIDLTFPGHGSIYAGFQEWRSIYARFSNNFAKRTFETDLSFRWQLTSPPPVTMPVEVPLLVTVAPLFVF